MKKTIEIKKDEKGFGTLYVNDEPFLILGGELHNSSSSNLQYMEKQVWPRLKELNLNTVLLPVAWENIEKEEGVYDFSLLEELIFQARREKMKLILLWFGLWKNGESTYVPGWVKRDSGRFFRARNRLFLCNRYHCRNSFLSHRSAAWHSDGEKERQTG